MKPKFTIKDLAEGRVAVKHDGKSEAILRKVMRLAFPADKLEPSGDYKYYFADIDPLYNGDWYFSDKLPKIPVQRAVEFIKK